MAILSGLAARVAGVLVAPRVTFESIAAAPCWAGVLALTFVASAASGALVLETDVGRLALLDQWERTATAFGRGVDDAQYAAMREASSHGALYGVLSAFTGGPVLAFALAGLLFAVFRRATPDGVTYAHVLAVVSHAGVILALRQLVAAPVIYARESLASPMTLSVFTRMLDEASPLARFFSIIDLFVLWWIVVLAVGMSILVRRPAPRLAGAFVGAYVTIAVLLTAAMAVTGGTA